MKLLHVRVLARGRKGGAREVGDFGLVAEGFGAGGDEVGEVGEGEAVLGVGPGGAVVAAVVAEYGAACGAAEGVGGVYG
jgi:hypothetical protein